MGVRVIKSPAGRLKLRLQWTLDGKSIRSQECIGIAYSPRTVFKAKRDVAAPIRTEMKAGRFDRLRYLEWFPNGAKAELFRRDLGMLEADDAAKATDLTLSEWYEIWIARQVEPYQRRAQIRDYRQHMSAYVLPTLGPNKIAAIRAGHVPALRNELAERSGPKGKLATKTVKNIIAGTLRACLRDARAEGLATDDPLRGMKWPRISPNSPDPFTLDERNAIVDWFANRQRGFYLPFIKTLFLTGMRHSEAAGLRCGDIDLDGRSLTIGRSRYLGAEAPTKTKNSERTIPITQELVDTLAPIMAEGDRHLFLNARRDPIRPDNFRKEHWPMCLRALEIRHRQMNATRHTFISLALTSGADVFGVAHYTGTSIHMIQARYGRWIPEDPKSILSFVEGTAGAKTQRSGPIVAFHPEKPLKTGTSPTGFEPVSPA